MRMLLVPALVSLFGRWGRWMPGVLATLLRLPRGDPAAGGPSAA